MNIISAIGLIVIIFGLINLVRMSLFLIGSDLYGLRKDISKRKAQKMFPKVSIIIPAFNEEKSVLKSLFSVLKNDYPKNKLEIIIVNDGSTDNTHETIKKFLKQSPGKIDYIYQENQGKAAALNNGIKTAATGELIMCLDADSTIAQNAIRNAVRYFADSDIVAVASNVKIVPGHGLLNFVQQYEYILAYQMKKALTVFNIEYIIGGIGSVFRKSYMKEVEFYDCNTVTEDIDITMKLLRKGNRKIRVVYADDVLAYTPSAITIGDLLKQRYRWKWGRLQTFYKNKQMFFAWDRRFTKGLSWVYLPFAIFSEISFILEPFLIGFIFYIAITYHDILTIISAIIIMTFYFGMNIVSEETLSFRKKLGFIAAAPFMYFCFYILSMVEYHALIKSIIRLPGLKTSLLANNVNWLPIERP